MIDREHIGREFPALTVEIEKGRLRFFAKAIGETNPIYGDEEAARADGHRSVLAPPTFVFCAEMDAHDPFDFLDVLGVDLAKILHGEQSIKYYGDICAGDTLTYRSRISDIYDKKDGALEFIVQDSRVTNQNDDLVAELRRLIVVRN